jgi:uncharacterized RDD family membrane protein YckC
MKCPKCEYLGFETGDRCKNCGYDFSLAAVAATPPDVDGDLRPRADASARGTHWDGVIDRGPENDPAARVALSRFRSVEERPPFLPGLDDGDEPLVKLPAVPRPPLAVRRTPELPKLRVVSKPPRVPGPEPALDFVHEPATAPSLAGEATSELADRPEARAQSQGDAFEPGGVGARLTAVMVDYALLGGIDLTVIYFTARMTELPMSGWTELPLFPLGAFLLLLKLSYFGFFTAIGGQTIGKMAMRIRVVTVDDRPVAATDALVRALLGMVSAASLGLGYVPVLFGPDHRAIHDRLTRTHVVATPST